MGYYTEKEKEYLYSKLIPEGTCLVWTGAKRAGYGSIRFRGKQVYTHRLSFAMAKDFPLIDLENWKILHSCPTGDNPACCNPEHLRYGTVKDNTKDASDRKALKGPLGTGRISPETVDAIRTQRSQGIKIKEIAEKYSISISYVSRIINKNRLTRELP